ESLTVIQPLYEGGQSASAIAAARFGVLLGRQQLQKAESDLVQQTVAVYDDVVRDRAIVDIYRSTVEQLEGELRETSARFKEHEVTFTD
ncbi:TolC family protein, partial [Clostridium perfringens]